MYVLDSDHLSVMQRQSGTEFENISKRCSALNPTDFFLTIVSFHEQFNGWTKFIARANDSHSLVRGYTELEGVIEGFARSQVLLFSTASAAVYDDLRKRRVRVGSMDLRIAAIVIANQMTLLTRNTVDFVRVPNLAFEDWTIPIGD